jgi:exonuclease SbcD
MGVVKFVQFSDVHLDASLTESKLALPEEKKQQRRREIRQLVADACSLAQEKDCDLILIPGDLFDDESADRDTIGFLTETFGSVEPLPIFMTPGNHDPYLPQSPYNSDFLAERGMRPWPGNVQIFRNPTFETSRLPGKEDIAVTGISNCGQGMEQTRILGQPISLPEAPFNILMFHGSREPLPPGKKLTMPFDDKELLVQGFDYAAIGHYHSHSAIRDEEGQIRGAYSGTPAWQRLNEAGEKFILIGKISEDRNVSLEKVVLDRRTLHSVEVDCSGLTHTEAVIRKIEEEARKASRNREDVLFVTLRGRIPRGCVFELPDNLLGDKYFHVAFDRSGLMPDYDLEKYLREPDLMRSVEGEFVKALLNREAAARSEAEKRQIRAALYYGLDALTEGKICGRYED